MPESPSHDADEPFPDPNEEEKRLHLAVGMVMTQWQSVERALCGVFKVVSTCRYERIAAAIFFKLQDFRDKLEITDAAARFYLEDDLFKTWRELRNATRDASELRNCCAHFSLMLNLGGQERRLIVDKAVIIPNWSNPNERFKGRKEKHKSLDIESIVSGVQGFYEITDGLNQFASSIPKRKAAAHAQ